MTDTTKCLEEKAPRVFVLTRPLAPASVTSAVTTDEARLEWAAPEAEGHSCLAGYSLALRLRENQQLVEERFVDIEDKRVAIFRDLLATVEYEESP